MVESRGGIGQPGGDDQLSMLRTATASSRAPSLRARGKVRMEMWAGALLVLGGIALALVLRGAPTTSPSATNSTVDTVVPPAESAEGAGILAGEVVVAFAVGDGNYPPSLRVGDEIRLIVTPGNDGSGDVRPLVERTVVVSIDPTSAGGDGQVISVRGPESIATALAASGPVHVAIVGVARP